MNSAPLIPMSPRPATSPISLRIPLTSPTPEKTEGREIPLTPLPPITAGKLPSIAMTASSPLPPPPSSATVALPPLSKLNLPPLSKSEVPVLKPTTLPPLASVSLPPISKTTLPPISKTSLPPISPAAVSKTTLPPISEVPKTTLPPIADVPKTTLPPIAELAKTGLAPISPAPVSKTSLPPISPAPVSKTSLPPLKLNLPPLSKPTQAEVGQTSLPTVASTLPPVSEIPKVALPPIIKTPERTSLPPIIKSPERSSLLPIAEVPKLSLPPIVKSPNLPPIAEVAKTGLPPLTKGALPPLTKGGLASAATGKPTAAPPLSGVGVPVAPLAVEVKETRSEQVEKIRTEVKKAEERQLPKLGGIEPGTLQPLKSLKPLAPVPETGKLPPLSEVKSVKPLPSLKSPKVKTPETKTPEVKSLVAPLSALDEAREGVRTAKGAEEGAAFQGNLATIASPANLPSKKAKDTTPKIRIPKIAGLAVKSSPKRAGKSGKSKKGEIELPTDSTVIPSIPITSPAAMKIPKATTSSGDNDLLKIINSIDVSKLRADRVKDKDAGYNVNDLKVLAGALNLPKSGNKKDLVDRIKALILKVKPNAFDQ